MGLQPIFQATPLFSNENRIASILAALMRILGVNKSERFDLRPVAKDLLKP